MMTLQHTVVPESKEVFRDHWDISKGKKSQLKGSAMAKSIAMEAKNKCW